MSFCYVAAILNVSMKASDRLELWLVSQSRWVGESTPRESRAQKSVDDHKHAAEQLHLTIYLHHSYLVKMNAITLTGENTELEE